MIVSYAINLRKPVSQADLRTTYETYETLDTLWRASCAYFRLFSPLPCRKARSRESAPQADLHPKYRLDHQMARHLQFFLLGGHLGHLQTAGLGRAPTQVGTGHRIRRIGHRRPGRRHPDHVSWRETPGSRQSPRRLGDCHKDGRFLPVME
jgi:hypothetical protein